MKKELIFLAALCLASVQVQGQTTVASGTCGAGAGGSNLTWTLTEDSTLTISGTGDMADFTSGNQPWEEHLAAIRTAVVQEGVTSVGNYFLRNCYGLTSVNLPDGLTSVGDYFLQNCTGLTSLTLPEGLSSVGDCFLYGCTGLTSIDLPDGLTSVGSYFLNKCTGLTSIGLPDELTSVGSYFLSNCTGLTSLTLPAGLTSAGNFFLRNCTGLQELTVLAATPPAIGSQGAFAGVDNTIPVYVPAGSTDTYASTEPWDRFSNYKAFIASGTCGAGAGGNNLTWTLTSDSTLTIRGTGDMADFTSGNQPWEDHLAAIRTAVVQEGVTSVGSYFLGDCTGLTSIDLPDGLTSVGHDFLWNCTGLQELTVLAATPPVLGSEGAFAGVDNTIPVYVPAGSTEAYAMADGWNYFTDYRAVGTTGIGTPSLAACVTVAGGEVRLHLADNPGTHVYDLQGRLVLSTTACRFALPPGIYIIKVGDDKVKVAL